MEAVKKPQKTPFTESRRWRHFKDNAPYLVMILPAVVVVFLFNYLPIYGVLIAFQDFMPGDAILSDTTIWVGFENFTRFFTDPMFWPLMQNTFLICIIGFVIGFPLPIIVSLMLNAMKSRRTAKVLQTIFNGPHFISLVVLVGMLQLFFGRYGLVNNIAAHFGGERYSYFLESSAFRPLYILSSNWQDFGWSAIIYIAALSNVDPQQHEAAILDGATRFQRVIHVDLPAIMPMISVMLIMSIGGLMGVGYEKALLMQTDGNLQVSELISTYVYKRGLTGVPDQAYATAIGLFNSIINVVLLIIANTTSKRFSENSLWYDGIIFTDETGRFWNLECSDTFRIGDQYYITYSGQDDTLWYAVSDTPYGPYGEPTRLDGKLFYAAKHVEDGSDCYMVGWARRSESVSSTQDVNGWAGNLCVQKLVQNADGTLALAPVDAIVKQFTARRELLAETDIIELASGSAYSFAELANVYEAYLLTGKIKFDKSGTFGLSFDYNGRDDKYKFITLNPKDGTISLQFNKGTTLITETAAPLEAGREYSFTLVQEGSVAIFYLDGIAALTVRLYGVTGKPLQLFTENNTVTVSDLKQYTR